MSIDNLEKTFTIHRLIVLATIISIILGSMIVSSQIARQSGTYKVTITDEYGYLQGFKIEIGIYRSGKEIEKVDLSSLSGYVQGDYGNSITFVTYRDGFTNNVIYLANAGQETQVTFVNVAVKILFVRL